MGKFDGILICTDLDGTLYKNDKSISKENEDAIAYFKTNGGKFTFITGRMPYYATDAYAKVKPNAPVGCINGGGLYDYEKGEYIWYTELSKDVIELIRFVDETMPEVGYNISTLYKTYFCKDNIAMERFRHIAKLPNKRSSYTAVDATFGKILFSCDNEESMLRLDKALHAHPLAENYDFIRSEKHLYEILPKNIGKGTALVKLTEYLHYDIKNTIGIGDYNNDVSLFRAAGTGIAVANASPEALAAADMVTVSNEEHAIAKVIYDIENGTIKLDECSKEQNYG